MIDRCLSRRALLLALLLFLLVTVATMAGLFNGVDRLVTPVRLRLPADIVDWLSAPFVVAGSVGATAVVLAILVILLLHRQPRLAAGLITGYLLVNVVELALKFAFTHPNPPDFGRTGGSAVPDIALLHLLTDANVGLLPRQILLDSYPSGHTARVMLLCLVTALAWPRWRPRSALPFFFVLLVLALILGGSHWPSDTLGGACLGWIGGAIANALRPRTATGAIRARTPPA